MSSETEIWDPISLLEVTKIFSPALFRWWIAGCHALELHIGRSWREHHDLDVSFRRVDYAAIRQWLAGWEIAIASAGKLSPWLGEPLLAELNENNLWCKETPEQSWRLDLTVSEGDDNEWIFRRNRSLRLPWEVAILKSQQGIPYLAPELQLLFKSKDSRSKDDQDAAEVIPQLDIDRQNFLKSFLPDNHSWRQLLG